MRSVFLSGLVMGVLVQAGPCKMSTPASLSSSPSPTLASSTSSTTSTSTFVSSSTTSSVNISTTSTPSATAFFSLTGTSSVIEIETSTDSSIDNPSTSTTSITSSVDILTTSTTSTAPFVTARAIGVDSNGTPITFDLPKPSGNNQAAVLIKSTPITPYRIAIDEETNRLYATWDSGEIRWANFYAPNGAKTAGTIVFSPASFIEALGRKYVACQLDQLGYLRCAYETLTGPEINFKVVNISQWPWAYTGPLLDGWTNIEIYLERPATVIKTVD